LRKRLALEQLEERVTPSTFGPIDSSTPLVIPLGSVKAGQTVSIGVDFSTTDNVSPDDRTEGPRAADLIDAPGRRQRQPRQPG
jgi:hypothetical protein